MRAGSECYNLCTQLYDSVSTYLDYETGEFLKPSLKDQKREATCEFEAYVKLQQRAMDNLCKGTHHLVFYLAENVILPHFLKNSGQFHFVTYLKFDIFEVSVSNLKRLDIYCLLENTGRLRRQSARSLV